ncbi:MAG TPA: Sm ribonucleo-like protein [Clostridia bacterium]|nr:Sm ribonucleo-like protein [Clostridia bacterium]
MAFRSSQSTPTNKKGKTPPPEETFEEAAYLKSLGEKQKVVSIKLVDGEIVRGWVEYYDRTMIRLTREDAPNLFIFKHEIMYIAESGKDAVKKVRAEVPAVSAKPLAAARATKVRADAPLQPASSKDDDQ